MTRPSTRRHDRTAVPLDASTDADSRTTRDTRTTRETRLVAAAFWTAVALPAVHVPLLVMGPVTGGRALVVLALVALNVLALVVGHPHGRNDASGT